MIACGSSAAAVKDDRDKENVESPNTKRYLYAWSVCFIVGMETNVFIVCNLMYCN